jgi:hypothetical protein
MACLCKNPDGTWAQTCNGTCSQKAFVEPNGVQQRSEKSMEDRFEYLLGCFLQKLDDKIDKLSELCMTKYREGYRDGFNDGQSGY